MRPPKKHLQFSSLRKSMSEQLESIPDYRCTDNINHSIHDVFMGGFAMMYFQEPSFLEYQKRVREARNRDNLETMFGVKTVAMESQAREIMDTIDGNTALSPIFENYYYQLQRGKHLEGYALFDNLYLCSIDGTQYYGSEKIHCDTCLTKEHRDGTTSYSHQALQAAIMHPNKKQVIPLMPEEIKNTDGTVKQDCEQNAAKRLLKKIRQSHPQLGLIILGDGLYSHQPMIEEMKNKRMHFILTAKPDDHKIMMEWIGEQIKLKEMKKLVVTDLKNRKHVYQFINEVPLNGNKDSPMVNYFQYQIIDEGIEVYKNSWVTDLAVREQNISLLVRAGRCRWKIENECFNTLKNQGYNIEHNYGHGKKHLSFNFYLLTLLAFFFHQIFELTDHMYQSCRNKYGRKQNMWNNLRAFVQLFVFDSWEQLLEFALDPKSFLTALSPPVN